MAGRKQRERETARKEGRGCRLDVVSRSHIHDPLPSTKPRLLFSSLPDAMTLWSNGGLIPWKSEQLWSSHLPQTHQHPSCQESEPLGGCIGPGIQTPYLPQNPCFLMVSLKGPCWWLPPSDQNQYRPEVHVLCTDCLCEACKKVRCRFPYHGASVPLHWSSNGRKMSELLKSAFQTKVQWKY